MKTKRCKICEQEKPISEFPKSRKYKNKRYYNSYCKDCFGIYYKNWRIVNNDKFNETVRKWSKKNLTKLAKIKARHRKLHRDREIARAAITYAIRRNRLTPKPCATCGDKITEAHHSDYSKPLEVTWLCNEHHLEEHGKVQRIRVNIRKLQLEIIQH